MFARFLITLSLWIFALPTFSQVPPLDDLMTPDEIAEELHLGPTEYTPEIEPLTPEQFYDLYRVNVLHEFPVVMIISKSSQTATVYHYGRFLRRFSVSTGRERWERAKSGRVYFTTTPSGWYSAKRYIRYHYSSTWEAKMEYSIFFNGGVAVHATTPDHYKELGKRASGGCVRMHKSDAIWFWNLSTSYRTASVPYFTRHGRVLKDRHGNIRHHRGAGTLFIVTSH